MGLGMYLTKKTYVKKWDHINPDAQFDVTVTRGGVPYAPIKAERVKYVEEEVCYWRKANQIHKWFVDHVQGGVDNCHTYYVSSEQLKDLHDTVVRVLSVANMASGKVSSGYSFNADGTKHTFWEDGRVITNPEEVAAILPTGAGYFFGGTDYDEWYIKDLEHTRDSLASLIAEDEGDGSDFYYEYESSW